MRQTADTEILKDNRGNPAVETTDQEIDHLFAAGHWVEPAALPDALGASGTPSLSLRLKRNLARNYAALQTHRPDIPPMLEGTPLSGRYQPVATKHGTLTIVERQIHTRPITRNPPEPLRLETDPIGEAAIALSQIEPQWGVMSAAVLAGVGDGHLLSCLGGSARIASDGAERPVIVIEPDLELLKSVLLLHDFSGGDGPIVQRRFSWLIGLRWQEHLGRILLEDPWAAAPDLIVKQGQRSIAISEELRVIRSAFEGHSRRLDEENRQYYDGLSAEMLTGLFGKTPPRPPRVLLPASRFTTVLQYAYRDAAQAFRELGWDVTLIEEPALHSRMSASTIRHYLKTIKPDLVLLIDHLRYEYGDLFPPKLPIATWTQDHLENLTCEQAGHSIGPRDFIWTMLSPMYSTLYGYPRVQCVPVAKLVHVRKPFVRHSGCSHDLVYVSHASDEPQTLVSRIEDLSASSGQASVLLPRCAHMMLRRYEEGGCFSTIADVGKIIDSTARDLKLSISPQDRYAVLDLLFYKLNNALYRQQALAWAIGAAKTHDLRLVIYGKGWDRNPIFAPYAAGPIQNGPPLEEVTRNARIVLQIVPYYCLHQRLLEGLIAGGFFLVRRHPSDQLLPALSRFVHCHLPADVANVEEARSNLDGVLLAEFNQLLDTGKIVADFGTRVDLVELIRVCQDAQVFTGDDQPLPRLDEVSFGSDKELKERVSRFIDSPELRSEIAAEQQRSIATRLSYRHGIKRAMSRMREIVTADFPSGVSTHV